MRNCQHLKVRKSDTYFNKNSVFVPPSQTVGDISKRISEKQAALEKLPKEKKQVDLNEYHMTVKSVLESYSKDNTAEENNEILSRIIKKINYNKTEGGRWKPSNLKIDVDYKM